MDRRAAILPCVLLSGCLFGGAGKGGGEEPLTWAEKWALVYGPGDEADKDCHDALLELRKAVKKGEREGLHRRLVGRLERLAAARREAETLILEARKDADALEATVAWEEVVTGWTGTELQVRKIIPVEVLEAEARKAGDEGE